MDVPENVEEIIEMLLSGLKDMVCLKGEILIVNFVFCHHTMMLSSGDKNMKLCLNVGR